MGKLLYLALIVLAAAGPVNSQSYFSERMECFVLVPPQWVLDTAQGEEIIISSEIYSSAFISLKRYDIAQENQIGSESELVETIRKLYTQVGADSAAREKITYSVQDGKATFETGYDSYDAGGRILSRKLLRGTIVREAGGRQVLYLMIASAPTDAFEAMTPAFTMVCRTFHSTMDLSSQLYSNRGMFKYFLIIIIVGLSIFFYIRKRRTQKLPVPPGRVTENFWSCPQCGRVNHVESRFCYRCGAEKARSAVPGS